MRNLALSSEMYSLAMQELCVPEKYGATVSNTVHVKVLVALTKFTW